MNMNYQVGNKVFETESEAEAGGCFEDM